MSSLGCWQWFLALRSGDQSVNLDWASQSLRAWVQMGTGTEHSGTVPQGQVPSGGPLRVREGIPVASIVVI